MLDLYTLQFQPIPRLEYIWFEAARFYLKTIIVTLMLDYFIFMDKCIANKFSPLV